MPSPSVPLPDISHQHEFIPRTRTVLIAGNWKMNPTSVKVNIFLSVCMGGSANVSQVPIPHHN